MYSAYGVGGSKILHLYRFKLRWMQPIKWQLLVWPQCLGPNSWCQILWQDSRRTGSSYDNGNYSTFQSSDACDGRDWNAKSESGSQTDWQFHLEVARASGVPPNA